MARTHDIGDQVALHASIRPTNATEATYNGLSVDRMPAGADNGYLSCVAFGWNGADSGGASSYSVTWTIQGSAEGLPSSADWATITTMTTSTADNTLRSASINLEPEVRYIRIVSVVDFTGGSTPAVPIAAGFVLGGSVLQGNSVVYSS